MLDTVVVAVVVGHIICHCGWCGGCSDLVPVVVVKHIGDQRPETEVLPAIIAKFDANHARLSIGQVTKDFLRWKFFFCSID
jgi:hypothetical protein